MENRTFTLAKTNATTQDWNSLLDFLIENQFYGNAEENMQWLENVSTITIEFNDDENYDDDQIIFNFDDEDEDEIWENVEFDVNELIEKYLKK